MAEIVKKHAVIDSDAFNEIDDQFAIAYLLRSGERVQTEAIYAAPFANKRAATPAEGMRKSYAEIRRLLELLGKDVPAFEGSERYLPDEKTPVVSPAARDLARRAMDYTPENPLYVIAIGAITNVASAALLNPEVCKRTVLVWIGGHAWHWGSAADFNMRQDIAAARVALSRFDQVVQLPCLGVVSHLTLSGPEMEYWLRDRNPLCNYLIDAAEREAESYAAGKRWTRVIWDVAAAAYLLEPEPGRFMKARSEIRRLPTYDLHYEQPDWDKRETYVFGLSPDAIFDDLFRTLAGE